MRGRVARGALALVVLRADEALGLRLCALGGGARATVADAIGAGRAVRSVGGAGLAALVRGARLAVRAAALAADEDLRALPHPERGDVAPGALPGVGAVARGVAADPVHAVAALAFAGIGTVHA